MTGYFILGKYYQDANIDFITEKLVYISYCSHFPTIENTKLSSDIGWGCTLRSGQMLLANTILRSYFNTFSYSNIPKCYYNILSYFRDNEKNIFSLHQFVKYYPKFDKNAGDWIGPYTLAKLVEYFSDTIYKLAKIKYLVFDNGELNNNLINFTDNETYLVTIPVRLSIDKIDINYHKNIIYLTKYPQFMGFIGGENNKSYYFLGSRGEELVYFDPHKVHLYLNDELDLGSYQNNKLGYLSLEKLSPTITICFYIQNEADLLLLENIPNHLPNIDYPLFTVNNVSVNKNILDNITKTEEDWDLVY